MPQSAVFMRDFYVHVQSGSMFGNPRKMFHNRYHEDTCLSNTTDDAILEYEGQIVITVKINRIHAFVCSNL